MSVRVTLNFDDMDAHARRAMRVVAVRVGREAKLLMGAREWAWPHPTERKNGTTAGLIRDVLDTRVLFRSQSDPQLVTLNNWRITWNADYAAAVFLGAVFRKRRYNMPARNVPLAAVRQVNLGVEFARGWRNT